MSTESISVFREDQFKSFVRVLNLNELKYLLVVFLDFRTQKEWTHVDDVHIRILDLKDSCDLSILLLFELFNGHATCFLDRE